MGWAEQQHKKRQQQKQREKELEAERQSIIRALLRFTFIGMSYLESNFRCKKRGLLKFVDYVKWVMQRIGEHHDTEFFVASNKYFVEKYDIDVMEYLGLEFEK